MTKTERLEHAKRVAAGAQALRFVHDLVIREMIAAEEVLSIVLSGPPWDQHPPLVHLRDSAFARVCRPPWRAKPHGPADTDRATWTGAWLLEEDRRGVRVFTLLRPDEFGGFGVDLNESRTALVEPVAPEPPEPARTCPGCGLFTCACGPWPGEEEAR